MARSIIEANISAVRFKSNIITNSKSPGLGESQKQFDKTRSRNVSNVLGSKYSLANKNQLVLWTCHFSKKRRATWSGLWVSMISCATKISTRPTKILVCQISCRIIWENKLSPQMLEVVEVILRGSCFFCFVLFFNFRDTGREGEVMEECILQSSTGQENFL